MHNQELIENTDLSNALFVDPGTHHSGYAFWKYIRNSRHVEKKIKATRPDISGVWRVHKNIKDLNHCTDILCQQLNDFISEHEVGSVILEFPQFWADSAVSHASASKGDLFKLAFVIGTMAKTSFDWGANTALIFPQSWKGQLKKDVVLRRINRAIVMFCRDHEGDAVGIGLHFQGKL